MGHATLADTPRPFDVQNRGQWENATFHPTEEPVLWEGVPIEQVEFFYLNNRFYQVNLFSKSKEDCAEIRSTLNRKYGEPSPAVPGTVRAHPSRTSERWYVFTGRRVSSMARARAVVSGVISL